MAPGRLVLLVLFGCAQGMNVHVSPKNDMIELMSFDQAHMKATYTATQMTGAECAQLVRGTHFALTGSPDPGYYTGYIPPIPRLGVPALKMADAGNGFRPTDPGEGGTSTCWPSLLALASTWDDQLIETVAQNIGEEFRGKGANVILGPSVNVHRVAKNGRNFEYLSGEDPYLGSRLTGAYVRGVQSKGVMSVAKHFAFNEQETDRMGESSNIDERTAWELYYPPFEAAVNAGTGGFMCAYNKVNGTWASEASNLLQRDLRGKMGFTGLVMSDWGATHSPVAIERGLDQEMPGEPSIPGPGAGFAKFLHSFNDMNLNKGGTRSQAVREAATHILTSIYRLHLEDGPSCTPPMCANLRKTDVTSDMHRAWARVAATSAVTLLKNTGNILPLKPALMKNIAILGQAADTYAYFAGGGSGNVPMKNPITPLAHISARAAQAGMHVFQPQHVEQLNNLTADVALILAGSWSSEGFDRPSLHLDGDADALIAATARRVPTVVLMQTPGAVLTPWRDDAAAILNLFFGGEETGAALAAVLFGDAVPAGKLPIMMPLTEADTIEPKAGAVPYTEELFTSYRSPVFKSAFPFGHGLSYTNFLYGEPSKVQCADAKFLHCISVPITNIGSLPGVEVVQAYLQFEPEANYPERVLRNYHKTKLLQAGETELVMLPFSLRDVSAYFATQGWVNFHALVHIGASSADIRHSIGL